MQHFDLLSSFIEKTDGIKNFKDLEEHFAHAIRPLGYEFFHYSSINQLLEHQKDIISLGNYPESWCDEYMENDYARIDITAKLALKKHLPFFWHDPKILKDITEEQMVIFHKAAELGLRYGVTVPLHKNHALPAVLNISSGKQELPTHTHHILHLMGLYLHEAALTLQAAEKAHQKQKPLLSKREKECLNWAIFGNTDNQIGQILDISHNTVHRHIESAKRKLSARNRIQAITTALKQREIHL